ncbi:hypothetical protein YC2023_058242 [Brassica napus]
MEETERSDGFSRGDTEEFNEAWRHGGSRINISHPYNYYKSHKLPDGIDIDPFFKSPNNAFQTRKTCK